MNLLLLRKYRIDLFGCYGLASMTTAPHPRDIGVWTVVRMRMLIRCPSNLSLDRRTSTQSSAAPSFESVHEESSLVTDSDKLATAKNKLRNLIVVSERKRGSVPYRLALAWHAHASGMHSRFCDTVGQNCGLAMMNLSHVEDEPELQRTDFEQFFHPLYEINIKS